MIPNRSDFIKTKNITKNNFYPVLKAFVNTENKKWRKNKLGIMKYKTLKY